MDSFSFARPGFSLQCQVVLWQVTCVKPALAVSAMRSWFSPAQQQARGALVCSSAFDGTVGSFGQVPTPRPLHTFVLWPTGSDWIVQQKSTGGGGGGQGRTLPCVSARECAHAAKKRSVGTFPVNPLQEIYADYKVKRWGHSRLFFPGKEAKT